jgi:hypothetical protein
MTAVSKEPRCNTGFVFPDHGDHVPMAAITAIPNSFVSFVVKRKEAPRSCTGLSLRQKRLNG